MPEELPFSGRLSDEWGYWESSGAMVCTAVCIAVRVVVDDVVVRVRERMGTVYRADTSRTSATEQETLPTEPYLLFG